MATGDKIIKNHIQAFRTEISHAKLQGENDFFTWFNECKDTNCAFIRGAWDCAFHIILPISKYINNPETKTILEIGHGGGRILASASKYFFKAIGIDIHNENLLVEAELKKRGHKNITLIRANGLCISVADSSVDIVYSFIVLQHIEKIKIFKRYIEETFRVLKPGGVAILYFGRYCRFSKGKSNQLLYLLDNLLEKITLRRGYREIPAKVNDINLIVNRDYARGLCDDLGFQVESLVVSRIYVPDGVNLYGGQHGIILKKPL